MASERKLDGVVGTRVVSQLRSTRKGGSGPLIEHGDGVVELDSTVLKPNDWFLVRVIGSTDFTGQDFNLHTIIVKR